MPSLTTSYFAVHTRLDGTKISIARYHNPRIVRSIDEVQTSFVPSGELLKDYKDGRIEWYQYIRRYTSEQRRHFRESPLDFTNLLKRATVEDIVLLCYERFEGPNTRCHRMLLYDILQNVAGAENINVNFVDEVSL